MHYVIGTGPSGVACAASLIAAGRQVVYLDTGLALEGSREQIRQTMAVTAPQDWTSEQIAATRTPVGPDGEVSAKLALGSDYPYRAAPGAGAIDFGGLALRGSHARGGLSNVWGGALMPFRDSDLRDWPARARDLAQAHSEVLKLMPFAAREDDLAADYPLRAQPTDAPRCGAQVRRFLSDAARGRDALAQAGARVGSSRLALRLDGEAGCNACARCMHGCPRNLVWSSAQTVAAQVKAGQAELRSGLRVEMLREEGDEVVVEGRDAAGAPFSFRGARAFVGAGAVHSAGLVLRARGWRDRAVTMLDSQYFLFPLLQAFASPDVARENQHVMAQAFVELTDAAISPYDIHVQIYGYNDLLGEILARKLGPLRGIFPANVLLGRMLLAQGYLHSRHSGRIEIKLGDDDVLRLRPKPSPIAHDLARRVMRKFLKLAPALRAAPLAPMAQITEPGRGFHIGGTFPMADNPEEGQTDVLGRLQGWRRIHLVDSSTFPTIAATTITQTVMANAWRIGAAAALEQGN